MTETREEVADGYLRAGEKFGRHALVTGMTVPRVAMLKRRRNRWLSQKPKEQEAEHALAEILMVLCAEEDDLPDLVRLGGEEWEAEVELFLLGLTDEELNGFGEAFIAELRAQAAVAVDPDEEGKEKGRPGMRPVALKQGGKQKPWRQR